MEPKPHHHSSSPSLSLLRDISNLKTPKPTSKNPNFSTYKKSPQSRYFTAATSAPRSRAERRLKAFETEQSKSSRKALTQKIKSLKSLSNSISVWLNFLLESPESCGCEVGFKGSEGFKGLEGGKGKRERPGGERREEECAAWRREKRMKGASWGKEREDMVSGLEGSLREVCSVDDLKERMNYVGFGCFEEVFTVMAHVTKTIDEGRLQMKAHCPIVTDVGLKEKALKILMCYNPTWLRIGLYIIFGGDLLLQEGEVNSEEEIAFLKMVIDKQIFSHAGLAKKFAYNKLVEGLYRAGYYETLGNIILKKFLLLVLILDQAKTLSCLPIKYGIDGLDGGSPLLFTLQSNIKTSSQVIHDFLSSDIMHGEGSVLAHLVIVGYKVSHQQSSLTEYQFKVKELFEDLCDGVRLCRVVQLLQHDNSILTKMVVPSDTYKKKVVNCGIALKALKQSGVPLCDEDGMMIEEEDIISGDKELTLSLLWNVFVNLQLPLLLNRTLLLEEISRIRGVSEDNMDSLALLDMLLKWMQAICETYGCKIDGFSSLVDGKAMWCLLDYYFRKELKCSCSSKGLKETSLMSVSDYTDAVHNFLLSQKLTTLLGNFPEVLEVSDVLEHNGACNSKSVIILLVFLSFQLVMRKNTDQLNFHKILGFSCQTPARKASITRKCLMKSEAVLNQETRLWSETKAGTRDFKAVMAWWQDMALQNKRSHQKPVDPIPISKCLSSGRESDIIERGNEATIIQSNFRKFMERNNYVRKKNAAVFLQTVIRAWLEKKKAEANKLESQKQLEVLSRCTIFIGDRRKFVKLKRSVILIQHAVRAWIWQKNHDKRNLIQDMYARDVHVRPTPLECEINDENVGRTKALSIVQQHLAASKIQCWYRVWFARKSFLIQKRAIIKIQSAFRLFQCLRSYQQYKVATIVIQSHIRGWVARKGMSRLKFLIVKIQRWWKAALARKTRTRSATIIQSYTRRWLARQVTMKKKHVLRNKRLRSAITIQSYTRQWLARREITKEKISCVQNTRIRSAIVIQSYTRRWLAMRVIAKERHVLMQNAMTRSVIIIQSNTRRWLAKRENLKEWHSFMQNKMMKCAIIIQSYTRRWLTRREILKARQSLVQNIRLRSTIVIQSYTRQWLAMREIAKEKNALIQNIRLRHAIIIQSYTRRWLARREIKKERHILTQQIRLKSTIIIQSYTRRWLARREITEKRHAFIQKTKTKCAMIIQTYTRRWLARREITEKRHAFIQKTKTKCAMIIQTYTRRWLARKEADRERHCITIIQAYWKGYLARKDSRGHLLDLRLRVQKSAANVDDGTRLINRLLAALSDLLDMKSVTGILHTCKTLDMATQLSQKCCEKLVEAGAIDTLLKLIRSVSRSVPDQQVLRHALSTLRNLAKYPHLVEELIACNGSITTIFLEFLRNKEEAFFVASELLKKVCSNSTGVEFFSNSPAFLKRLHNLVEDLKRQATNEKRNMKGLRAKEQVERRFEEAADLLKLLNSC